MRKTIIKSLLAISLGIFGVSCQKGEVLQDVNSLGRGSYVTLVSKGKNFLDATNPAASKATLTAKQYGLEQEKIIVYVTKGSPTTTRSAWKKIKEIPIDANGEYKIEVTGTEILTALGLTSMNVGDTYTLYNSCITKDGQRFDYGNINTEVAGNSNYNMALTWQASVTCSYDAAKTPGKYLVVRDGWEDWLPGDIVDITAGPGANQVNISQVWPNPAYASIIKQLYIDVNPSSGEATTPVKYDFGQYSGGIGSTGAAGTGLVLSCTGDINVSVPIVYNGAPYATCRLTLKKQ